jgi:hypothetical protein
VLTEVAQKEERTVAPSHSAVTVAEIDRTVKKYADNLLHALEGVSARLSQLESRTHCMESSMDDLKLVIRNYTGATDGKLRQFENILCEVSSLHYKYCFYLICHLFMLLVRLFSYATNILTGQAFFLCNNRTDWWFSFDMNQPNSSKIEL